jgi:hypothetical protein
MSSCEDDAEDDASSDPTIVANKASSTSPSHAKTSPAFISTRRAFKPLTTALKCD